jgi:hypothetical protein
VLSQNGTWWWNGRRWVAAVSEDGLWRWNGTQWKSSVELDGKRPEQLEKTFTTLADDCYAKAGGILADRAQEWQPEGEVQQLVGQVQGVLARLREVQSETTDGTARGRLLGRHPAPRERPHDDDAREALASEYMTLALRIGRIAPQPTFKEADDMLTVAKLLDERAAQLNRGVAEVEEAERVRREIAVAAHRDLSAAEEARVRAIDEAKKAIEAAQLAHRKTVAGARAELRSVLTPGPGELKAALGSLRLHATALETPSGRLPAAGLTAFADTAEALWKQQRQPLIDLLMVGSPEVEAFLTALTEKSSTLFLFFGGPATTALFASPRGDLQEARRFAEAVTRNGTEAVSAKQKRDSEVRSAEASLDRAVRDRSAIDAAEAELARLEAEPGLLGAIDTARRRVEHARGETPELIAAKQRVVEIGRHLTAAPAPPRVEPASVGSARRREGADGERQ